MGWDSSLAVQFTLKIEVCLSPSLPHNKPHPFGQPVDGCMGPSLVQRKARPLLSVNNFQMFSSTEQVSWQGGGTTVLCSKPDKMISFERTPHATQPVMRKSQPSVGYAIGVLHLLYLPFCSAVKLRNAIRTAAALGLSEVVQSHPAKYSVRCQPWSINQFSGSRKRWRSGGGRISRRQFAICQ